MEISNMKTTVSTLALIAAGFIATTGTAAASEPAFVMKTSEAAMYGADQVDAGQFGDAAQRLERMLDLAGTSLSKRQPALTDLCISYTMLGDLEAAEKRCEQGVENGRDRGAALNNRGVMRITAGDYDGAVRDFLAALEAGGARAAAEANLALAQQRVAEQRSEQPTERAADNDGDKALERDGDEQAAVLNATFERFARVIEADALEIAAAKVTERG